MAQNYVLLERIELNASAASVTFSNIPQTGYTDLKIVVSARIAAAVEQGFLICQPNSATTNLSSTILYGFGNNQGSSSYSVEQSIWSYIDGSSATSNTFSNNQIYIPNYNSSSAYKSISVEGVNENNAVNARQSLTAGLWSSNTAISSVKLYPTDGGFTASSFLQYSTFSLYGVAAVGTTPAIAPKARGGNNITTDGTYWYHAFLTSGTFTPFTGITCDALLVAGGGGGGGVGGGGYSGGGGGGAGGFLGLSSQALTATSYSVQVGAGGAAGVGISSAAIAGSNSQIGSLTAAVGGGQGGTYTISGGVAGNGGSGGGMTYASTGNSTGTSGQGNAGGSRNGDGAGGGGGAGAAGSNAPSIANGGNGGAGLNTYSSWATATSTGASGYYAGGGGGAGYGSSSGTNGNGGSGGGGAGGLNGAAVSGTNNTGGGGGGSEGTGGASNGGSGGSGIVIIRYAV